MFLDISIFEVDEDMGPTFERDFRPIVERAQGMPGCLSSELIKLDEVGRYAWVERWASREEHNAFNEVLFGELLPRIPDIGRYARRLVERDAEGYRVV